MKELIYLGVLMVAFIGSAMAVGPRDAQWKRVDAAVQQGLPQTAIKELGPIIQAALAEKAYAEAGRAIARRILLEGTIQGNKAEEKISRLEAEITKAPKELVPIFDTIQAEWYWQYFEQNRWRFMQRSATAEPPGKDLTTWDLTRLFVEIDLRFQKALGAAETLKKTPVSVFDDLLEKGNLPDKYRPTLYDFIAQEALHFYTSGEQVAAKPKEAFEVPASSPMLAEAEAFLAWKPVTRDTNSPMLRAITLYQDLLKFHRGDAEVTAFLDADLARLSYGKNVAQGEERDPRFKAALKAFADKWRTNELSTTALFQWATVLEGEGDLVEAHNLALRAIKAFPESAGGKECRNLITRIEAKSSAITTERIWNRPLPKIVVQYRNVDRVYFRVLAYDWNVFLGKNHRRPESLSPAERKALLGQSPVLEWSIDLPPTVDYKQRTEEIPAPEKLKPGFYFLVASHDPKFGELENQVSYADIWVSDLALVLRSRENLLEGFVLEANSGEPVAGAEVQAWRLDRNGERVAEPVMTSDKDGFFSLATPDYANLVLRARHQGRELGSTDFQTAAHAEAPAPEGQTIFFTDRAIYRPGQTVQYKGICLRVDARKDDYQLLKGRTVTVVFNDPNGKEIARAKRQCNDYGSFSGSFTAPRDRLMGMMSLAVVEGPSGQTAVQVEEYKRPKFQVTLEAPKTAARVNDKVILTGHALAYTGAAIDAAQVKYRVTREVRYPIWWGYFRWRQMPSGESQEISHGEVTTAADGSFKIEFNAKPDGSVPESDEPTFNFQVVADVTDSAGETRSADHAIRVGYTALQASLSADEWQTEAQPVSVQIRTTTLDGEGQVAEGSVKLYRLQEPETVQRPGLAGMENFNFRFAPRGRAGRWSLPTAPAPKPDLSNPNSWALGALVETRGFSTDAKGEAKAAFKLGTGAYRALLETQDRFGKRVTALVPIMVLKPDASKLAIKVPNLFTAPTWSVEPGDEFSALWGTGYDEGRAFVEIEHRNKIIRRYWTKAGETQSQIKQAVTENLRGGFTVHVTRVRENRAYLESRRVDVPWSNKDLQVKWEHFTSKLAPGQKETWTAVITGSNAQKAAAEMVATLYDQSLDAFTPLNWMQRFGFFRQDYSNLRSLFENAPKQFQYIHGQWAQNYVSIDRRYRSFPFDLIQNFQGYGFPYARSMAGGLARRGDAMVMNAPAPAAAPMVMEKSMNRMALTVAKTDAAVADMPKDSAEHFLPQKAGGGGGGGKSAPPAIDLGNVSARKNLQETAFFFPQLVSDTNGEVRMNFTMPEALTQWKFTAFAHDKGLRSGFLEGKTVTAKDLMVQPNPPRFLREGDVLEFTVKVSNQTTNRQSGKVRLTFSEATSDQSADARLGNTRPELAFEIAGMESRSFSWRIKVPDGQGFLTYKAVGSSGTFSDGEEGFLPVLSRMILVTESMTLPIRGPATNRFEFKKLVDSAKSTTLRNQTLTVQMVSNPAWYAVMALPYLMEYPHECSEQTFNRFYANAMARMIAGSDPKIRRVFEQWKGTPALDSPLEKNQDLKSVMIEETPWLRQAQAESQARRNVGVLFDENRLNQETASTLQKLRDLQLEDGAWVWFPGGRANDHITLYITTGFGRLRHVGVDVDITPAIRSLTRLDGWVTRMYEDILAHQRLGDNHLNETVALYLYGRSFFLKDKPVAEPERKAVDYFLAQAKKHWLTLGSRQSQGHVALALQRFGDTETPAMIMKSLKERSVTNPEMGRFWRDTELSWWWYHAPIESQAVMIEAFDEIAHDAAAVEDCKVWLLKQKQTQDWKTTKATADAVYALLLHGANLLASDALVEVSLGGKEVKPVKVEGGTGFYEQRFVGAEIKPKQGEVTVKKVDTGVAWGSLNWQYLEDISKVTPHEGTPLKLKKSLFIKRNTDRGPLLEAVKGQLAVGDELVVRIELRTDRDMEYVHMKDQRGSGLEPTSVLSRYKYQDGLGYYESTRDTASHFFIDYLPKGVYVFEYSTRVVHRGEYQSGMAEIQCMYAPEFNSHSESLALKVK